MAEVMKGPSSDSSCLSSVSASVKRASAVRRYLDRAAVSHTPVGDTSPTAAPTPATVDAGSEGSGGGDVAVLPPGLAAGNAASTASSKLHRDSGGSSAHSSADATAARASPRPRGSHAAPLHTYADIGAQYASATPPAGPAAAAGPAGASHATSSLATAAQAAETAAQRRDVAPWNTPVCRSNGLRMGISSTTASGHPRHSIALASTCKQCTGACARTVCVKIERQTQMRALRESRREREREREREASWRHRTVRNRTEQNRTEQNRRANRTGRTEQNTTNNGTESTSKHSTRYLDSAASNPQARVEHDWRELATQFDNVRGVNDAEIQQLRHGRQARVHDGILSHTHRHAIEETSQTTPSAVTAQKNHCIART
jgi:hypothetical protein